MIYLIFKVIIMPEEKLKDSNVKSTIEAVEGLVRAVPIYDDALQPAAKQIGRSLEVITRTVNIALSPMRVLVWGFDRIEAWLLMRLPEKLKHVPEENIVTPPANVAGPAIEALRFAAGDDQLRELYANLIAAAMDKSTVQHAHPGYVEILKNLCSDEALVMQAYKDQSSFPVINIEGISADGTFVLHYRYYNHIDQKAALGYPDLILTYIDNLVRLGLLEVPDVELSDTSAYVPLEIDPNIENLLAGIVDHGKEIRFQRKVIRLTVFGAQFVEHVVKEKE